MADDFVVVVMAEKPIPEPAVLLHLFQKIGEGVRLVHPPAEGGLDAGGGAVGEDVVHFVLMGIQRLLRMAVLFLAG